MDWRNLNRTHKVWVEQLDPANPNMSRGVLEGVDLSNSSINAAYYTDTRYSGRLRVVGENWIRGSFLRIHHEVPEFDFSEVLGTYLVTNDDCNRLNGEWIYDLELSSVLYGLSTDIAETPWVVGQNAYALTAMHQILNNAKRQYIDQAPNNHMFRENRVLEAGESQLSRLYALCDVCNNRLEVDAFGRVVLMPYVLPSARGSSFEIDLEDTKGIAMDNLQRSTNWLSTPGRAAVVYRYQEDSTGEDKTIVGTADATDHAAPGVRGYVITDYREIDDLNPATAYQASLEAKAVLQRESREDIEYQLSTTYLPVWEGDIVDLIIHDGLEQYQGRRKCMVKAAEINLQFMTMNLSLKEVGSILGQGEDE